VFGHLQLIPSRTVRSSESEAPNVKSGFKSAIIWTIFSVFSIWPANFRTSVIRWIYSNFGDQCFVAACPRLPHCDYLFKLHLYKFSYLPLSPSLAFDHVLNIYCFVPCWNKILSGWRNKLSAQAKIVNNLAVCRSERKKICCWWCVCDELWIAVCRARQEKCTLIDVRLWNIAMIHLPTQTAGMPCLLNCLRPLSHVRVARSCLIIGAF